MTEARNSAHKLSRSNNNHQIKLALPICDPQNLPLTFPRTPNQPYVNLIPDPPTRGPMGEATNQTQLKCPMDAGK